MTERVVIIRTRAGSAQVIVTSEQDHLQACWRAGIFYEGTMLEHIQEKYSGGTFVDAGSSIGNHTLFFAKFCNPSRVISIEPVVSSMELQERILKLNGVDDLVRTHAVALGNRQGHGAMRRFGEPATWNMGMYKLEDGDEIDVTTLDALVTERDVTVIKLDVEWSELRVLQGAEALLSGGGKPALFVELSSKDALSDVKDFLARFGYSIAGRYNRSPTYEFT